MIRAYPAAKLAWPALAEPSAFSLFDGNWARENRSRNLNLRTESTRYPPTANPSPPVPPIPIPPSSPPQRTPLAISGSHSSPVQRPCSAKGGTRETELEAFVLEGRESRREGEGASPCGRGGFPRRFTGGGRSSGGEEVGAGDADLFWRGWGRRLAAWWRGRRGPCLPGNGRR